MDSGREPIPPEVLDLMDRLERDELRRAVLRSGWGVYRAAVEEGIIGQGGVDLLARCMQQLSGEKSIAHGPRNLGATPRPVWDGAEIQQLHDWRVTAAGRQDAKSFRQRVEMAEADLFGVRSGGGDSEMSEGERHTYDVFISHASEDKEAVAKPLAHALTEGGWAVWLDELELTVGDSLTRRIDQALVNSRFGVVILSHAFFSKEWPQRELAGLAAREIDMGSKVILPVWHGVDHHFIVQRSAPLADRLGALTSAGLENVVEEISRALESSGAHPSNSSSNPLVEALETGSDGGGPTLLSIPSTPEAQARVIAERPDFWEYQLFAGKLMGGRLDLEDKWRDHELRLPGSTRRDLGQEVPIHFLNREMGWLQRQIAGLGRIFDPATFEQAFGKLNEPGNASSIEHLARRFVQMYGAFMDWAADLRSTNAPSDYEELVELYARLADGPVRQMRGFIQEIADQTARLPVLAENGTDENPVVVHFALTLSIDKEIEEQLLGALERVTE